VIWVFYAVESLAVSAVATVSLALGLWVHDLLSASLLWLPLVTLVVGLALRTWYQRSPVPVVRSWHESIRRRIDEGQR
jgi:hypothetical protein